MVLQLLLKSLILALMHNDNISKEQRKGEVLLTIISSVQKDSLSTKI